MTRLELALGLVAMAVVAAAWVDRPRARRLVAAGSVSAIALVVVAAVTDRIRWPTALLVVGVGIGAAVAWRRRVPMLVRAIGRLSGLALVGAALVALWAFPRVTFPAPEGASPVGTTVVQWTDAGRDSRPVVAQLWYPSDGRGPRSWYLGRSAKEARAVARALGSTYGVPAFLLEEAVQARTPAAWRGRAEAGADRWPVVLFSPGLGGYRTQSTAWAMEVASHGYVVVALDHAGDSAVVVLDDGTLIPTTVRSTGNDEEDDRNAARWTAVRAADLRFVLSRLEAGDGLGDLAARIDAERVVVTGHSLGGAAALQAAFADPRFDAAVDIDGFPRNIPPGASISQPVLAIEAGRGTGDAAGDAEYRREIDRILDAAPRRRPVVVVDGAAHLSFTDAPRFLPPLPSVVGSLGRGGASPRTARTVVDLLDEVFAER